MISSAVITAGGTGTRVGRDVPKQFIPLGGLPMIVHTLRAFERAQTIDRVVVTLPEGELSRLSPAILMKFELTKVHCVVPGGPTRQASVARGLEQIDWNPFFVAIHDAARALITPELIDQTVTACDGWDGAIAALPVGDTLKEVLSDEIIRTHPREKLWAMQTPQVFHFPFLKAAYEKAENENFAATDDAAVAEYAGGRVRVSPGNTKNFKITFEEDLALAETLLRGGA